MDRRKWLLAVGLAVALIIGIAGYMDVVRSDEANRPGVITTDPDDREEQPSAEGTGAVEDEVADSPDDPVPMALLEELFDLLNSAGHEPATDVTYTVQFVESLEKVRIAGVFEDGKDRTFIFILVDGEWEIEE